ncbi:hypothetical protein [Cellulomonas cellasea]|uniref:Uncharacterized protein n=2 Tax=Cellulomonas cellasea TaxID=43670 RepID=A0A0A0BBG2_9CELL|nr:hypothetical protein [Cellulomonas cellasea]KGM03239.1 hypothetical protein Q760_07980 [Cellulomonas cellasea DSM 20118]GEA87423.1 hypothetical protein CCE01nite_13720 [Cellulomonas cellasea]
MTWDALEQQIRKVLDNAEPAVAALVSETLSWASERDVRVKRNKAIHDEWPLTAEDGLWVTRFNKRSGGLTVVGSQEQAFGVLAETAEQLSELAGRLDAITRSVARSRVTPAGRELPK